MLHEARTQVLLPRLDEIIDTIVRLAHQHADQPMLARTLVSRFADRSARKWPMSPTG